MVQLEQMISHLNIGAAGEVLRPHWEASLSSRPMPLPAFLTEKGLAHNAELCGLDADAISVLETIRQQIVQDEHLIQLAWHCHNLLYTYTDYEELQQWPCLSERFGDSHGAFYLIVATSMVPLVEEKHRELGVDPQITQATCKQVSAFAQNYKRMADSIGIPLRQLFWLRHYPAGRLFRIGRMEYMIKSFAGKIQVYRHKETAQTVALCDAGVDFNEHGFIDGQKAWCSSLQMESGKVIGQPISPKGFAERRSTELDLSQWKCVLQPGDSVLDMHIPAGGGMQPWKCRDSMAAAASFFTHMFPDVNLNAIVCNSWIFNSQLEEIPLSSDNLVQFQRELYLFPVSSQGNDGLWFIFFQDPFDPATAPQDTSLQRSVAAFLAQGNQWRSGGMFFLLDDLRHFGTQHYRSQYAAAGNDNHV